jgi:hypothetical protein
VCWPGVELLETSDERLETIRMFGVFPNQQARCAACRLTPSGPGSRALPRTWRRIGVVHRLLRYASELPTRGRAVSQGISRNGMALLPPSIHFLWVLCADDLKWHAGICIAYRYYQRGQMSHPCSNRYQIKQDCRMASRRTNRGPTSPSRLTDLLSCIRSCAGMKDLPD